jgi:outer membrane PBP1 activator LpoA protein
MKQRLLWLTLLVIAISGCTVSPQQAQKAETATGIEAERAFQSGDYQSAVDTFSRLAEQNSGAQRNRWLYRTAAALARSDHTHQAKQLLQSLPQTPEDPLNQALYLLTRAHIAIAERRPEQVLALLGEPLGKQVPAIYQADYYDVRADAYTMLGNRLETARELVARETYLVDKGLIEANQKDIWNALSTMTERALEQLRTAPPPDTLSGWMDLVRIAKTYQLSPQRLKEQLLRWRQEYPNHPASEQLLQSLSERKAEDVAYPDRVALLLPLSGRFSTAAQSIRDGIIAAYYTHPNENQTIRIYDTGKAIDVTRVYRQAVDDGAEFIIGPLDKAAVTQVAHMDELDVPTLALNYLGDEEQVARANLFQFGLSPEEEARQVAERTWLDGHVNAAVLVPQGPWGQRIENAFDQRWKKMGGAVVESQTYDPAKTDFSIPIRMLLNIDDSYRRYRQVSNVIKRKVEFTARRRQDIDFIFIAAFPRQARQIRPQLKFYHAADVPVYATSHVFTGTANPERDRDMDGIVFGDMPWVLSESSARRGIRPEIERYISEAGQSLQRLYALGIDSFNIIGALNTLRRYSYERYDGETGSLALDNKQRVRRQLVWVKFRSGRPVALDQGSFQ